jgi:hypothetical protein
MRAMNGCTCGHLECLVIDAECLVMDAECLVMAHHEWL